MTIKDSILSTDTTITGIVFDLDGTLVDSAPDITDAINLMLASHDIAPQRVDFVERFIGEGSFGLVHKLYKGLGMSLDPGRVAADVERYLSFYRLQPVRLSTVFADALVAIPALHAAGLKLGICTNKAQLLAESVLRHFDLHRYFCAIVGGDALEVRKPDPGHLLETLDRMAVAPTQALFIGDTNIDAECACRAGVRYRIVDWGTGKHVPVEPDMRLGVFGELLACRGVPSLTKQPG